MSGSVRSPKARVELYGKLEQAVQQTAELDSMRSALVEVLGRMRVEERALERNAIELERNCAELQTTLDGEKRRSAELAREITDLERQAVTLKSQTAAVTRRLDTLKHEASSFESALRGHQEGVSDARNGLDGAYERIRRLEYRLRFLAASEPSTPSARATDDIILDFGDG